MLTRHSERSEEYFSARHSEQSEESRNVLSNLNMERGGFTYIMTNKNKTTLYVGVTSDLENRIFEHKNHLFRNSFTDKYNIEYCIYYEYFNRIEEAIIREKQIKGLTRAKKEKLINTMNPTWSEILEVL